MNKIFKKLSSSALLFCLASYSLYGQADTERDFQTWFNLTATGHFAKESRSFGRFKYWLEGQERLGDESSRSTQSIIRPGVGYYLTDNVSLWLGYAWINTSLPLATSPFAENRIWQQLLWVKSTDYLTFTSRTRTEQRFFRARKVGYRLRQLAKLSVPLMRGAKLSLVSSDELFWHLGGDNKGFDQNRAFIGLGYSFNSKISGEIGYMNQSIRRTGVPNFCANILAVNLSINS